MNVDVARQGEIAVVTLSNPPVNALGRAVRQELLETIDRLESEPAITTVILTGAGKLFVGGADISEFDQPPVAPHLPDILARIEASRLTWIAAVHGMALGGGLELAMACRFRLAAPGSRFGLPEVNLGLIPGAGGTQRLPRLIGVERAVPVVAEKRMLDAADAFEADLVDSVIEGPFIDGAMAFAKRLPDQPLPRLARERPIADPGPGYWQDAAARIAKAAKGEAAHLVALEAVRLGVTEGFDAGQAHERQTFLRLREGEEAQALRYLFFAERASPRPADLRGTTPLPLACVGVVGGGTMGAGIAAALRNAGLSVILSERDDASLQRGLASLRAVFDAAAKRGSISVETAALRMQGVSGTVGLEGLSGCDLVIEAVFEDLAVKREVFGALTRICPPQTILATNTSYIDPEAIFDGMAGPDRFIGLHFFSPAQVMKLLEIVPLSRTSGAVLATAFDLAARLGKVPVRSGICDGFIGNRILRRYRAEAEAMLREGVSHSDIDAAMRGFGYGMGPFEMQDLAGLDISFMHREAARARGEMVPETPGDVLVRAGRKGQKTGGGWYDYAQGDRKPRHSDRVVELLAPMLGARREMGAAGIVERLIATMADEGQKIIDEGIAALPQDIDLVEVHGYGFPRVKGGPMFLAARKERPKA